MPGMRKGSKNPKLICHHCKLEIEEKENSIECDKCENVYHVVCTQLDKRRYERLLKSNVDVFVCLFCTDSINSTTVRDELLDIKTKLNKLDQLSDLQESINFMSIKFDDMLKIINDNKKKIQLIEKENRNLKNEIATLKNTVKMLGDHRVKNDCLISGIKVEDEVNAVDAVIKLSKSVNVDIEESNIEDAYFLKKKNLSNQNQTMVVKFNSKKAKDKLMAAKPRIKENEQTRKIYINDYLSKESFELFKYAKTLKTIGYLTVYTTGGKIYARKSLNKSPKLIRSEQDVDDILLEATTTAVRATGSRHQLAAVDDEVSNHSHSGTHF